MKRPIFLRVRRRKGSVLATSLSLVAIFTTLSLGVTAYFTDMAQRGREEAWNGVAEEAAHTGMSYVMSWVEAALARDNTLPREMRNLELGKVIEPLHIIAGSTAPKSNDFIAATDIGGLVGTTTREYLLGITGKYRVSFKARIQRMRLSTNANDANQPDQYQIGIIGRVRANRTQGASGTLALALDSNENSGLVAERALTATIGREPFAKYAAIFDSDAIRNWVPGEGSQGPVHFNRGDYIDGQGPEAPPTIPAPATHRTLMNLYVNDPRFSADASGIKYPIFHDLVTMTVIPTALAPRPSFSNSFTEDTATYGTFIKMNEATVTNTSTTLNPVFTDNGNLKQLYGAVNGPKQVPYPIQFPRTTLDSLSYALGAPQGAIMKQYASWFQPLADGLYVFTEDGTTNTWALSNPISGGTKAPTGATARPTGGIYIRGNVEIMRMAANATQSLYLFQLGYGAGSTRRVYAVIADRSASTTGLRVIGFAPATASTIRALTTSSGLNKNTIALIYAMASSYPTGQLQDFALSNTTNVKMDLQKTGPFPFNGVVFVDMAQSDPERNTTYPAAPGDPVLPYNRLAATPHPNTTQGALATRTGNIYSLGDIGEPGATWPSTKHSLEGVLYDSFCTSTTATPSRATGLMIMTVGNIFIQNHIISRDLATNPAATPAAGAIAAPFSGSAPIGIPPGTNVTLGTSRDLLGLLADKQILVGLAAPSVTNGGLGLRIDAAVTGLGDPARPGILATVPAGAKFGPLTAAGGTVQAYNGSFMAEGLMRLADPATPENYYVVRGGPTTAYTPANANTDPGNPIYQDTAALGGVTLAAISDVNGNPNKNATGRGQLLMFGSLSVKKRGIVGLGNRGYNKDYRYDKRLKNLAPPLYPTSTNYILKAVDLFTPQGFGYSGTPGSNGELRFLSNVTVTDDSL